MRTRPGSPPGLHAHLSFRKLFIIQSGSIFINQVKHNKKKKTQLKAKAAPNYINIETHAQHTPTQTYSHTCTLSDAGRTSKIPRVLDAQTERRNVWCLTAQKTKQSVFSISPEYFLSIVKKCLRISQKTC